MAVKPACSQSPSWPMHGICSHGIFPHVETLDMNEVERLLDAVPKTRIAGSSRQDLRERLRRKLPHHYLPRNPHLFPNVAEMSSRWGRPHAWPPPPPPTAARRQAGPQSSKSGKSPASTSFLAQTAHRLVAAETLASKQAGNPSKRPRRVPGLPF